MKKTIYGILIALFVVLFTATSSFAATVNKGNATMTLVEDNICNITFGQYGEFEKRMIECNTTEKYVDIRLTARNNAEMLEDKKADVVLLIDASRSMSTNEVTINGETMTRKEAVLQSAQTLIDKLLAANPNIKIGIVEFATSTETDDEGYTIEGTDLDAKTVTSELTNDADVISEALDTVSTDVMGARTNVEVGLDAAYALLQTNTDSDTEKYIITLTDAIPNTARGVVGDTYTDATRVPTRNKIVELGEAGVNLISMLIEMSDSEIAISQEDPKPTYREVAEEIFGTVESPTTSKYFYVPDSEVEDTIVNDIFDSLVVRVDNTLKNIVIKDYFPQEIIDNFDFEYVASPNVGNVSQSIDTSDNSITWNIELLSEGETASLSYKLTLKDDYNKEIIDQILPTNKKVDITAENNGNELSETSDVSPTVRVRYENNIVDNTIANKVIPQTGENSTGLFVAIVSIIAVIVIARMIYLKKYSDK